MRKTTEMIVSEFIRPATVIKKETEIGEALNTMREKGVEFLSVVDEHHKLIGCVNDVCFMRLIKQAASVMGDPVWYDSIDPETAKQSVEKIMTTNISTVRKDDNLDTAFKVMDSVGYKLLHVIDGEGKLLGIVTIREMFHKLLGA
jgi:predicted transcriptional regulator